MNQIGRKFDSGKPEFSLLPPWATEAVARVLTIGAQKYEVNNWKFVPNGKFRYVNAAMRHLFAHLRGEIKDPETGESHLAHAICCLMFILDSEESGVPLADAAPSLASGSINPTVSSTAPQQPTATVSLSGVARPTQFFSNQFRSNT